MGKDGMEMKYGVKQEAPWHDYQKMLKALFERDCEIEIGEVEDAPTCDVADYVLTVKAYSKAKYDALECALSDYKMFGSVQLHVLLIFENKVEKLDWKRVFLTLFEESPMLLDIRERVDERTGVKATYVRFEPKALQFHSDSMDDYDGNTTMLAADMAREVFSLPAGVFLCTGDVNELPY